MNKKYGYIQKLKNQVSELEKQLAYEKEVGEFFYNEYKHLSTLIESIAEITKMSKN